jgi:hypothetical protein
MMILGDISDSLLIVATATAALVGEQEATGPLNGATVAHALVTLEHGVSRLKGAYDNRDLALKQVRP